VLALDVLERLAGFSRLAVPSSCIHLPVRVRAKPQWSIRCRPATAS
jgi:hypothetical protein